MLTFIKRKAQTWTFKIYEGSLRSEKKWQRIKKILHENNKKIIHTSWISLIIKKKNQRLEFEESYLEYIIGILIF